MVIKGTTKLLGVIGYPAEHSESPDIATSKSYHSYLIESLKDKEAAAYLDAVSAGITYLVHRATSGLND